MARACAACGRPNSDTATKCLYCSSPLSPPREDDASATAEASEGRAERDNRAKQANQERYLVILLPEGSPPEEAVGAFSRIAGVSPYDARLSLATPRPRLFRWLDTEAEARRMSQEFSSARLPHYVVSESSVVSLPVAAARALDVQDRHIEIRIAGALSPSSTPATLTVPHSDLLLLVRGEITRERHDERRLGTARSVARRLTSGLRLHLYPREASVAVEIDPESFDFDALGPDRSSSVLLNLDRLISRLLERVPSVELDRGFDHEPPVVSRSVAPDLGSALAGAKRGPDGSLYDNEAQFRFYARWRYRVARHLAAKAG